MKIEIMIFIEWKSVPNLLVISLSTTIGSTYANELLLC